jgi:hypothetical protein
MPRFPTDNRELAASNIGDKSFRSDFTSETSLKLADANSTRSMVTIFVETNHPLYVLYGAGTASTTNYSVKLGHEDYLEVPRGMYDGEITAIFVGAGTARVTELYE